MNYSDIERNNYFYGKLLSVRDMEAEQNYHTMKRHLINRVVLGTGVMCGLGVALGEDGTLTIESGLALDYTGREIVVSGALIRKLEMFEGYEELKGHDDAYLCLEYAESGTEAISAVGSGFGEQQFNRICEGYRLFLTSEPPEYANLFKAEGRENIVALYSSDELTLVLSAPSAICAGESFDIKVLMVKNNKTLPVHFSLSWENGFIEAEDGRVLLEYAEPADSGKNVAEIPFRLTAHNFSELSDNLFPNGIEMDVEIGTRKYRNFIQPKLFISLCANREKLVQYQRITDSLSARLEGAAVPIYLAKLDLISAAKGVFVSGVTPLPFEQTRHRPDEGGGRYEQLRLTTSVKTLEYWQRPDVRVISDTSGQGLHLEFMLPKPENYDYRTSHGAVDVQMPGGIKVNGRYFSDEIQHGLGPGNVSVSLFVEFMTKEGAAAMISGNSEVFRAKGSRVDAPWVEAAVVVYPEQGTMKIGVWAHDVIDGNLVRIHYFAEKPERDSRPLLDNPVASIKLTPEIARIARLEKTRFKAEVLGSPDKNVVWEVSDPGGGSINSSGAYQAPDKAGTYEIIVCSASDKSISASAFVIVE